MIIILILLITNFILSTGKIKKGLELHAMCFVFKTAVVFLCKERLRQKKKSIIVSGWSIIIMIRSYDDPMMIMILRTWMS